MNSEKSKTETTKKELTDLSKKQFDPKIQASIDKKLKGIDKPVKKIRHDFLQRFKERFSY